MMLEFKYDTQLLIEGEDLDEDVISEYFTEHFKGCLLYTSRRLHKDCGWLCEGCSDAVRMLFGCCSDESKP